MFAGLNGAYGAMPKPPEPPSPEKEKEQALERLSKAAVSHAEAIARAAEVPGIELVPQALVDAILAAGAQVDLALGFAARRGATPREMAATSGLHPSYVRELLAEQERWPD